MRLKHLLSVFLMLITCAVGQMWGQATTYTSNVTLSTSGGTNAYTCTIKVTGSETSGYSGIRIGKSKNNGSMQFTVPSGTTTIYLHAAAWSGEAGTLTATTSVGSITAGSEMSLTVDANISGSGPDWTLSSGNKASTDYFFTLTLSGITSTATITLTSASKKRAVIWGVNSAAGGGCDKEVTLAQNISNGSATFNPAGPVETCSATASDCQVSVSITPTTGYALTSGPTVSGVTGATISGSGPYTIQLPLNGNGALTLNATCSAISVTGVSLNKNSTSIVEGSTETLTATISPSNALDKAVTWSSNATGVATVNSSGVVTAKTAGNATITVTTHDGSFSASCTVTVTALPKDHFIDEVHGEEVDDKTSAYNFSSVTIADKSVATSGSCEEQHYHFVGWITKEKYDAGTSISNGDIQTGNKTPNNSTYYAVWAKGSENITAATVIDSYGNGSSLSNVTRYSTGAYTNQNPVYIKFDDTGDYIQFNLDYPPTSVSFDYKMVGGANTSTMTIQECSTASGTYTKVQDLSISGTQNSTGTKTTTNSFSQKYIRMYFTKGSNVGVDNITIQGYTGGVSYSDYIAKCCTPLASINGSVNRTSPTSATLTWDAVNGAEKYQVKVPGSSSHNDWTDATSGVSVTGLACGTAHTAYFRAIDTNGSHCAEGPESTKEIPAKSWTVTATGVTHATPNEAWPATACADFSRTLTVDPGYEFPTSLTVVGADYSWAKNTGVLTIKNITGNVSITLTPTVKTYTISYKDQGGEDFSGTQTDAPTSHTYGTATTLKIPTKANNNFGGWFTSVDCTTGAVGDAQSATLGATDYTADVVLYAKWVANQHTITYNGNGSDGGTTPVDGTAHTHGSTVKTLYNTFKKTNYEWDSWNTQPDGQGTAYDQNDDIIVNDDITLYAIWNCIREVNVQKGSPSHGTFTLSQEGYLQTCGEGGLAITVTPSPATGYQFSEITQSGTAEGTINQTAKTITYEQYAHGASTINVTFAPVVSAITWDLNYQGAPAASSTDYTYAGEALELPAPTRTGYDFVGWFTDPTNGSQIDNVGGSNKPYAATTYYAHWTIHSYTVTWKVAGNEYKAGVTDANNHANYNTTVSAPTAPAASLLGEQGCADTFMGWSTKNGGHDAKAASFYDDLFTTTSPAITEETIFYAVFAKENTTNSSATFDASNVTATPATGNNLEWQHTASGIKLKLSAGNHYTSGTPNTFTVDGSSNAIVTAAAGQTITGVILTSTIDKNDASKHYKPNSVSSGILGSATSIGDNKETYEITGSISSPLTIYATTRQLRIVDITINYSTTIYSDYVTECAPLTCSVPQSLSSEPGKNGATISWSAPEVGTASKYQYAVWADGEEEPTSEYSETTYLTASVSGLISNTDYNWKVRTICTGEDGESEFVKSTFTTGSVNLTFSVPAGVSPIAASTSASALPSAGVPAVCGDGCWVFAGWSSYENATSVEYKAGNTYKFNGDKTLYAVYGRPSNSYKRIDNTADLTANTNYIITAISSETEYALTSEAHASFKKDAKSLDITAKVEEVSGDYFISNPDANYIWKFTGNASAGKLYNAEAHKYIQLSNYSNSSILDATGENLVFTSGSDAKWTIKNGTAYLRCYSSGFDASSSANVYLYKQGVGSFTTNPDCAGHTVKWYVIDTETPVRTDNDVTSCDGIASLPSVNVAGVRCKTANTVFRGWSETNVGYEPIDAAPADLFTDAADAPAITEDKNFYAVFAEATQSGTASKTVKYSVATASTINTTGTAPAGASASYSQTYTNGVGQMTQNNSTTLTLSNWGTTHITKLVLSMRSNSSGGRGCLKYSTDEGSTWSYIVGSASGSQPQFSDSEWHGGWSTSYVDVTKGDLDITCVDGNDLVIEIAATTSSLYCQSYEITYDEPVYSYDDYFTECCPQKAVTLSGVDDEVGKHFEADVEAVCAGETVTLTKTENGYYNFAGFTVTDEEENSVDVTANLVTGKYTFVMPETAVTVTASWTAKNYIATITDPDPAEGSIEVVGGTIVSEQRQVAYGGALTVTAHPKDDDHYFQNWTVSPAITGLNISDNPMVITMPGNNITVTANFGEVQYPALTLGTSDKYTLTAKLANGDNIPNMGAIRSGTAIKVTYELIGQQEFDSWNMNDGAFTTFGTESNVATFNMPDVALNVDLNVIAYYTLNLNAENGSISAVEINNEPQTVAASYNVHAGETIEVTAEPESINYKFKQWNKTGNTAAYDGSSATATLTVGTANITLEAIFENKESYDLTLVTCGKTQEVIPALEGTPVYSLITGKTATALTGYTFMGWSATVDGAVIDNNDLKLNNNTSVYAVYKKDAYYEKVTATSGITNGQYLIVFEDGDVAFNGGLASNGIDGSSNYIDITINSNKIDVTTTTEAAEFTIDASAGTIKAVQNYYIQRTSGTSGGSITTTTSSPAQHTLTIENGNFIDKIVYGNNSYYLRWNSRFRYYLSGQDPIQLYKKVVPENNESNPSTVVANGEEMVINTTTTLNDLTIEAGGKVSGSEALTVNNVLIKTSLGTISGTDSNTSGKSGEISNSNINASGEVWIEIELTQESAASYGWYAFSVPFRVDAMHGVYGKPVGQDWQELQNEVGYAIMKYHGDVRAQGLYGWKKYRDIMEPGTLYIIAVGKTEYKTLRFKKVANANIVNANQVQVYQYPLQEGGQTGDNGWNGVGNPNLQVSQYAGDLQFLDHEANRFILRDGSETNLLVGTAFMMQHGTTEKITIAAGGSGSIALAPAREPRGVETQTFKVYLTDEATGKGEDNIFLRTSEEATNEYETGRDLAKMSMGDAKCAQMWVPAYGTQLCAAYFPLINNKAEYPLSINTPKAGTYSLSAQENENATIYLTRNGRAIWNLSMSACELDLTQGLNEGYGLRLVVNAPAVVTGVDQIDAKAGAQKVIIDEHVYILRGGQMYDVNGKMVK